MTAEVPPQYFYREPRAELIGVEDDTSNTGTPSADADAPSATSIPIVAARAIHDGLDDNTVVAQQVTLLSPTENAAYFTDAGWVNVEPGRSA